MRCIWCLRDHSEPAIEHVIPQAIGCPEDFVLQNGEVCRPCNNRLGKAVDLALVHNYEQLLAVLRVRRKGRGPRPLSGIGNVQITETPQGPHLTINLASAPIVDQSGTRIGPMRRDRRHATATFRKLEDGQAEIKMSIKMTHDEAHCRALHKIALGLIAFYLGPAMACEAQFDAVREYVIRGVGTRRVLMFPSRENPMMQAHPPWTLPLGGYAASFILWTAIHYVDLTNDQGQLPQTEASLAEKYGGDYTWTPIVRERRPE